jgi:hypothetical protein
MIQTDGMRLYSQSTGKHVLLSLYSDLYKALSLSVDEYLNSKAMIDPTSVNRQLFPRKDRNYFTNFVYILDYNTRHYYSQCISLIQFKHLLHHICLIHHIFSWHKRLIPTLLCILVGEFSTFFFKTFLLWYSPCLCLRQRNKNRWIVKKIHVFNLLATKEFELNSVNSAVMSVALFLSPTGVRLFRSYE